MSSQAMKRHRRRLGAYDPVEEASLRRLQTIGFPVEVTLKKYRGRKILVCIPVKHCMFVQPTDCPTPEQALMDPQTRGDGDLSMQAHQL